MYSIPGDNYIDFRLQKYAEYCGEKLRHNDGDFYPLKLFCKSNDPNERVWVSFLYSTCYSAQTTALLLRVFPNIESAEEQRLKDFWKTYKDKLIFQSDRRYVKIMDRFVPIVISYKSKIGNNQQIDILQSLMKKSQAAVYNWFSSIYYCGRFSTLLFLEAIYDLLGYGTLLYERYLDWGSCKTCAQGICVICYNDKLADELHDRTPTKQEIIWLESMLKAIIQYTESYLGTSLNFADAVGYCCGYFKLYKGTRYLEFYTDRRLEELRHYQKQLPEYNDLWDKLFQIRIERVPHEILGELNGWNGIRKERLKRFLTYGTF